MSSESIYTWAQGPGAPPPKQDRFVSNYKSKPVSLVASTFQPLGSTGRVAQVDLARVKRPAGTFGPADCRPKPDQFLKAGSKMAKTSPAGIKPVAASTKLATTNSIGRPRLPAIAVRNDEPIHGLRSNINFVQRNALDAILSEPPPDVVDVEERTPFRHLYQGRVPDYLSDVRIAIEEETERMARFQFSQAPESGEQLEELSAEERAYLKEKMEQRLHTLSDKYQKVSIHTVVEHNRRRNKEAMERDMSELERHLRLFSHVGPIYVRD